MKLMIFTRDIINDIHMRMNVINFTNQAISYFTNKAWFHKKLLLIVKVKSEVA